MKIFLIVLLTIYIVILLLVLGVQILFSLGDNDQSTTPWKMFFKQSFLWPWMLIKFLIGVNS